MLSSFSGQKIKRELLGRALELICYVEEEKVNIKKHGGDSQISVPEGDGPGMMVMLMVTARYTNTIPPSRPVGGWIGSSRWTRDATQRTGRAPGM
ncbi:hypothetical protein EYF80_019576 [Liparis tanakae]|uniref:Uncharacterized protein n=1 Tax=Liparis tanakae TaxID=230148 RepID=A0A4Z2HXZ8_9TELE|nr:hypothetical protein EYF80_019576 [Liparis tanakae]